MNGQPHTPLRRGVSLLELMVALTVLGVLAGVVGLAAPSRGHAAADPRGEAIRVITAARRRAIGTGAPVRAEVLRSGSRLDTIVASPDGSVLGSEVYGFDPLSGRSLGERGPTAR